MRRALLEHRQGNNDAGVGNGYGAGGDNARAVAVAKTAATTPPAVTTAREATAVTATLVLAICEVSMMTTSSMTMEGRLRHGSLQRIVPTMTSRMRTTSNAERNYQTKERRRQLPKATANPREET